MHGYVVKDWCWIPILLIVEHIIDGINLDNLTKVLFHFVDEWRDFHNKIINWLVPFGVDGMSVFQGLRNGVLMQFQQDYAPFCNGNALCDPQV